MNKVLDAIQKAYDITDRMSVSGMAIEQMASLRQALREAYAAAKNDRGDGE
jgi:hypothetical protein